jgi:hypothetical protein
MMSLIRSTSELTCFDIIIIIIVNRMSTKKNMMDLDF